MFNLSSIVYNEPEEVTELKYIFKDRLVSNYYNFIVYKATAVITVFIADDNGPWLALLRLFGKDNNVR